MTVPNTITPRPEPPKPEDIKAQYGFVALLAERVPEVRDLLNRAVAESWTSDRFSMALANTNWWKNTPVQSRQWLVQQIADPATAERNMQTGADQISQVAKQFGFTTLDNGTARVLWLNAQLAGYDEAMTRTYVFNHMTYFAGAPTPVGGEVGQRIQDAQSMAAAYGYDNWDKDSAIQTLIMQGISGGQDRTTGLAAWRDKLQKYASAKYAPFADRIAAGETVADIAAPYRDAIAQTLELNPQDIGLDDKYIQKWLQGKQVDPAKPPVATALWEAQQELRQDSRWQYTRNAWEQTAKTAEIIGKAFGMVG